MKEKISVTNLSANKNVLADLEITKILFQGEVFCLQAMQSSLQERIFKAVKEAFAPYNPPESHLHFSNEDFIARVNGLNESLQKNYTEDITSFLESVGLNLDSLYWDKLILRVVPPSSFFETANVYGYIYPHRDTWGVNIYSQWNWWSPLFELEANRSFQFFPEYWDKPIKNTTAEWSFKKYLEAKKQTPEGNKVSYPTAPECLVRLENGNPVLINPREWLIFSAAHLHSSIKNTSEKTRFNIEFRTIDKKHLVQGLEAPNVDNSAEKKMPAIFSSLKDRERLKL